MKKGVGRYVTQALEIPCEAVFNVPLINIVGRNELDIENHKSILEYSDNKISLSAQGYIIEIDGKSLELKTVTAETVSIKGVIGSVAFREL